MSEATPQAHEAAKTLSPQARKLLAQLSNSGAPLGSSLDDGFDGVMDALAAGCAGNADGGGAGAADPP